MKVRSKPLFIIASFILMSLFIADYELQYRGVKIILHLIGFAAIFFFSNKNVKMSNYTRSALAWAIVILVVVGTMAVCAIAPTHSEDGLYDFESHITRVWYIIGALFAVYLPQVINYEKARDKSN